MTRRLMVSLIVLVLASGSISLVRASPFGQTLRSMDPCAVDSDVGFNTTLRYPTLTFETCTTESAFAPGDKVPITLTLANSGSSPLSLRLDMQTFITKHFDIFFRAVNDTCLKNGCAIPSGGSLSFRFAWIVPLSINPDLYELQGSANQCFVSPNRIDCFTIAFAHLDIRITK